MLLFAEILCIRWLSCELIVVRIFPNLVVMVALVSTSTGLIAQSIKKEGAEKKASSFLDSTALSMIAAAVLTAGCLFAVPLNLSALTIKIEAANTLNVILALVILFSLIGCLFTIFRRIGISLGAEFEKHEPLVAYSINLLGSIAGTAAIALVSWFSFDCYVWLLVLTASILLVVDKKATKGGVIALGLAAAATSVFVYSDSCWSPYSKLTVVPVAEEALGAGSYVLNSNNEYFHTGLKILPKEEEAEFLKKKPNNVHTETVQYYYRRTRTPFLFAPQHDDVLILGAGSGNDAACALSYGAKSVDAVEIDPVIATYGKTIHPNKPWLDPRVKAHAEDARSYLRYTKKKYDLILFADLDPGATIKRSSFLRIDNFVYTEESMKAALNALKPDGVVVLSYATGPDNFITERIYNTIIKAWGQKPFAYVDRNWDSVIFVFGPGAKEPPEDVVAHASRGLEKWPEAGKEIKTSPATDDWPFLFTEFNVNGMILYFSVLLVAVVIPTILAITKTPSAKSKEGEIAQIETISPGEWGNMFFLGQAFMLVETKSITQLSLLFGATWLVSSIVIMTILLLAWTANLFVLKYKKIPLPFLYLGLLIFCTIDYLWRVPEHTTMSPVMVGVIASLIACGPILFGSMTFSRCFRDTKMPLQLLSANLLGVAFGGLTENLSLWFGLKGLPIIAFALYALSGICLYIHHRRSQSGEKDPEPLSTP